MYEIYPYFTNDGSVGLFNPEVQDIYHSTYGALTEAYEKFILPAELDEFLKSHNNIKILDICYGIGYNSKSFLNYLFENNYLIFSKKSNINILKKNCLSQLSIDTTYTNKNNLIIYNDKIDGDNTDKKNISSAYNDKVYSNNVNNSHFNKQDTRNNEAIYSDNFGQKYAQPKIYIKALDIDKNLFSISPFIRQGNEKDKIKYNNLNFNYEKISKLLDGEFNAKYYLTPVVNLLLFNYILQNVPDFFENKDLIRILNDKKYNPFFDKKMIALYQNLRYSKGKYNGYKGISTFLHNIYYNYLSKRYKRALNSLILNDFVFDPIIGDARVSIKEDTSKYNFIFLDAFTPAKCPSLWSLEFFKLLFEHLEDDGMILTYSNSAAIRNAMLNAGFHVGKIYNEAANKFTGTIAVKNKSLIKFELSEYDLGLMKTKAGIFYRDENLSLDNEAIIAVHKIEVETSSKISSSAFIKNYRRKNEL